ncbi:MAG: cytochrome P450 [Bradymonadia bacterium]
MSTAVEIPSLPSSGLLGHSSRMASDPLGLFMDVVHNCGDIAQLRFGPVKAWCLSNPEYIEHVLVSQHARYRKDTRGYRKLRLTMGQGLVTSEGDFWLRQRRIAQPAFARKTLKGFAETMTACTDEAVSRWSEAARAGQSLDMARELFTLTLKIAGLTLCNLDMTDEASRFGKAVDVVLERFLFLFTAPVPWPEYVPTPATLAFWRANKVLKGTVEDIITQRRASGAEHHDLLGMFMAATDEETGEGMSDRQLRDEALTMLLAGHETTANALAWTLHLLTQHPEVARRIEAELDTVLGADRRLPTLDDLKALQYTTQVFKESVRLFPPVWVLARRCIERDEIGGFTIEPGHYVFFSQWSMHRHPRLWQNPERFDPDRFAPEAPNPGRFLYFPFSRGRRQCIGDRFAEMEGVLLLAVMMSRLRFDGLSDDPVIPEPTVTLRPKGGLPMRLTERAGD